MTQKVVTNDEEVTGKYFLLFLISLLEGM
jgi:hypothetical protein